MSVTVSAVCSEAEPLKIGARSQAIDWEVVYSDVTDWGRFGRAPNLSERKSEDEGGERYDGVAEDDADVKASGSRAP